MRFSTKKGFTIREILVIVVVISVGLLSVIVVLNNGMKYVEKTRQKVVALNLAREGMEAVYHIRDTNRQRRAGKKDACRLKRDPLVDEGSIGCSDDQWISSGFFVLERLTAQGQEYFALTGAFLTGINLGDGVDAADLNFSLCQQESGLWYACVGTLSTGSEGKYFRQIQGWGLYKKNTSTVGGDYLECGNGLNTCGNAEAKEFRFCSKVAYIGNTTGEVQFCGMMTNFKE